MVWTSQTPLQSPMFRNQVWFFHPMPRVPSMSSRSLWAWVCRIEHRAVCNQDTWFFNVLWDAVTLAHAGSPSYFIIHDIIYPWYAQKSSKYPHLIGFSLKFWRFERPSLTAVKKNRPGVAFDDSDSQLQKKFAATEECTNFVKRVRCHADSYFDFAIAIPFVIEVATEVWKGLETLSTWSALTMNRASLNFSLLTIMHFDFLMFVRRPCSFFARFTSFTSCWRSCKLLAATAVSSAYRFVYRCSTHPHPAKFLSHGYLENFLVIGLC